MSGLAAGIRLAHYGKRVVVCERHSLVGGLNSFYRRYGHNFEVGLHAMTNYVPRKVKDAPLTKLLRQLRIRYNDLGLREQKFSRISFGDTSLKFSNDFCTFEEDVLHKFPDQVGGFHKLLEKIRERNSMDLHSETESTRAVLSDCITDPLLVDMILCPVMFYGNANEYDMDFDQFCIMFQSVFLEGFCRPAGGVRHIINLLVNRLEESGGELCMNCGVASLKTSGTDVTDVVFDNGEVVQADAVLSCAGYLETMSLCADFPFDEKRDPTGKLSFVESIFVLDCPPAELGFHSTITFFNDAHTFEYCCPSELVDYRSGVICAPNNFTFEEGEELAEGMIRMTNMADYRGWDSLSDEEYQEAKNDQLEKQIAFLETKIPHFREHIVCTDMFTPKTITRFTGHINGAVYGSPKKRRDGVTPYKNLFICGTDQGFLGITGSLLSGISIANYHLLR